MVKDLKGILGMISLDIYQIISYSSYSKEHIICLIFKRLGFFMNTKVWLYEARFYSIQNQTIWSVNVLAQLAQKVRKCLSKRMCSRQWSQIFKFKTIEKHSFIPCFRNFQNIMHKCLKYKSIYFMYIFM